MEYQYVSYRAEDHLAYVTINRPKALNALNNVVIGELLDCFQHINADPAIGCVILTGSERSFVAGADIGTMRDLEVLDGRDFTMYGQQLMDYIEGIRQPVIAAVNGFALGGGCELAMACDIRIASEKAKFGQPEVNLGIIPGFGGTQRLPRLVGKGMAKYLIMTGEHISAQEALRIGLVQRVVPPEQLMEEAKRVAKLILSKAPVAIRMAKCAVNTAEDTDMRSGIAYEAEAYTTCFQAGDRVEGMTAFLEKRPAAFQGK
ncbi:MAG: crotonase [Oscillospiraceae bacterium]|nr:crotonase [Oscillospiraceae bacterium]